MRAIGAKQHRESAYKTSILELCLKKKVNSSISLITMRSVFKAAEITAGLSFSDTVVFNRLLNSVSRQTDTRSLQRKEKKKNRAREHSRQNRRIETCPVVFFRFFCQTKDPWISEKGIALLPSY